MRAAIITPFRHGVGGVESVTAILETILHDLNFKVDYFTIDGLGSFWQRWTPAICRPMVLARQFNRQAKNYDLVLCNGEFAFGVKHPKCIDLIHGTCHGLRRYLKPHVGFLENISLWLKAVILKQAARGKYVVAVSDFTRDMVAEQGIRVHRVIANSVDTNTFCPSHADRTSRYLFVGYHNYYAKGFDILERIAARGLPIDCVTSAAPGRGLGWIKNIPNTAMPEVYRRYRALIFPSRYEGLQMTPLEAMACGLPVIISNVGLGPQLKKRIPEFVVDGWDDRAVDEYVHRIRLIESDYAAFADKARQYAVTYHSLERFTAEWQEVIKHVCAG